MATVNVPEGFVAVVVLMAKAENSEDVSVVYANQEEGTEHALIGDAIAVLAAEQVAITDGFIEEIEELENGGDEDEEEDDEEPAKQ